jgi:hypothetical protein
VKYYAVCVNLIHDATGQTGELLNRRNFVFGSASAMPRCSGCPHRLQS